MAEQSKLAWLFFLNHVFKDSPNDQHRLLPMFSDLQDFKNSQSDWESLFTFEKVGQIERALQAFSLPKLKQKLSTFGVQFVALGDSKYPKALANIYDPPLILYYKGNIDILNSPALAVVGARQHTRYGREITEELTRAICKKILIVSGLAMGIDTIAHQTAIASDASTVAVLAHGLDIVHPKPNQTLAEKIIKTGCLVSEYPIGTQVLPFRFPQRNRIISGLCRGVLVTEAKKKGGSLVTCRLALEQNRDVFAVPGSVFSFASQGCLDLLKDGAVMVRNADDILQEFFGGIHAELPLFSVQGRTASEPALEDPKEPDPKNFEPALEDPKEPDPKNFEPALQNTIEPTLDSSSEPDSIEFKILSALSDEPSPIEAVVLSTKLSPSDVAQHLVAMELDGQVICYPGQLYARTQNI